MTATMTAPTSTAQYDLVTGEFSAADAHEILNNLFMSKINFHAVRNFRSEENCGKEDSWCNERLSALREARVDLKELMAEAQRNGSKVQIQTEVKITIFK